MRRTNDLFGALSALVFLTPCACVVRSAPPPSTQAPVAYDPDPYGTKTDPKMLFGFDWTIPCDKVAWKGYDDALLQKACDLGDGISCENLGVQSRCGFGVPVDPSKAFAYDERACASAKRPVCDSLAIDLVNGEGTPVDGKRAAELLQKMCDGGSDQACLGLGMTILKGVKGAPSDHAHAVTVLAPACGKKNDDACDLLAISYATDDPPNFPMAKSLWSSTCDRGFMKGCANWGVMEAKGFGGPVDFTRAASLFKTACDGRDLQSCRWLGELYVHGAGVPKDPCLASRIWTAACNAGDAESCRALSTATCR